LTTVNNIFQPLRNFSKIVKSKDEEFKKFELTIKDFDTESLSWIMKTQLRLNMYINDFKSKIPFSKRTSTMEQELSELQSTYIKKIISEIPQDHEQLNQLFISKVLEVFAMHNRQLSSEWEIIDLKS
jgi:hypothetical protein